VAPHKIRGAVAQRKRVALKLPSLLSEERIFEFAPWTDYSVTGPAAACPKQENDDHLQSRSCRSQIYGLWKTAVQMEGERVQTVLEVKQLSLLSFI